VFRGVISSFIITIINQELHVIYLSNIVLSMLFLHFVFCYWIYKQYHCSYFFVFKRPVYLMKRIMHHEIGDLIVDRFLRL